MSSWHVHNDFKVFDVCNQLVIEVQCVRVLGTKYRNLLRIVNLSLFIRQRCTLGHTFGPMIK